MLSAYLNNLNWVVQPVLTVSTSDMFPLIKTTEQERKTIQGTKRVNIKISEPFQKDMSLH